MVREFGRGAARFDGQLQGGLSRRLGHRNYSCSRTRTRGTHGLGGSVSQFGDSLSGLLNIGKIQPAELLLLPRVFFIFVFFKKKLQKYIFSFRFYSSIPLPPGREAVGRR